MSTGTVKSGYRENRALKIIMGHKEIITKLLIKSGYSEAMVFVL
jgi:hypothetical protein